MGSYLLALTSARRCVHKQAVSRSVAADTQVFALKRQGMICDLPLLGPGTIAAIAFVVGAVIDADVELYEIRIIPVRLCGSDRCEALCQSRKCPSLSGSAILPSF